MFGASDIIEQQILLGVSVNNVESPFLDTVEAMGALSGAIMLPGFFNETQRKIRPFTDLKTIHKSDISSSLSDTAGKQHRNDKNQIDVLTHGPCPFRRY